MNICYVLLGDFNARTLTDEGLDKRSSWHHLLKTNKITLETNQDVLDNRERFVDFVHEKRTWFKKHTV